MLQAARRTGSLILGWTLLLIGIPVTPLPIPLGLPMIAIGVFLLVRESRTMREAVAWIRLKWPGFSHYLNHHRPRFPRMLRYFIRRTDPRRVFRRFRHRHRGQAAQPGAAE